MLHRGGVTIFPISFSLLSTSRLWEETPSIIYLYIMTVSEETHTYALNRVPSRIGKMRKPDSLITIMSSRYIPLPDVGAGISMGLRVDEFG